MDTLFRKVYHQIFSEEIYKFIKFFSTAPPFYILQGENGENLDGKFYEDEIIKTTKFQIFFEYYFLMDGHYHQQQAQNKYFCVPARQRGSVLGSLALRAARFAIPFVSKYVIPSAKRIGKEFAANMLPEVMDIVEGKTSMNRAVKRAATTTAKRKTNWWRDR